MNKLNFHYVAVLLHSMFDMELEDEDLEEIGLMAWELIGNKDVKLYRYHTTIGPDNSVTLPCNLSSIEAVTSNCEDWSEVTNYSELGDVRTQFVENSIEASKRYNSPYYSSGKLLKYESVGNTLYFSRNYGAVNILYKGILMDDEGLPQLTDKEALAIATFLAYTLKYKEGLNTNNNNIINQASQLYQLWLKRCDQARVTYLSQNDMNTILDIKNSYDRHFYGKSSKPIK